MDGHAVQEVARQRLLEDLGLEDRRLEIDGIDTRVLTGGAGRPLLFLHGGSQAGSVLWCRVLPRLAKTHRVIAPDLPGLGESAPLPRLDADSLGAWLGALLTVTGDEPPTLVAHSLPANLAARFAAHHPDALRALVLVAAPGVGTFRPPPAMLVSAIRLNLRPSRPNLERFSRWPYLDPHRTRTELGAWHDALEDYLLSRATVPHVRHTMTQIVRAGRKGIPAAERHAIAMPVELVWGGRDRMAPLSAAESASRDLGWGLRIIDDAGHLPHVEQPEAFVAALEELLAF